MRIPWKRVGDWLKNNWPTLIEWYNRWRKKP